MAVKNVRTKKKRTKYTDRSDGDTWAVCMDIFICHILIQRAKRESLAQDFLPSVSGGFVGVLLLKSIEAVFKKFFLHLQRQKSFPSQANRSIFSCD